MAHGKPTFMESTLGGIKGTVKGLIAGGAIGAATGGVAGVVLGIFAPPLMPLLALGGALIGGATLGSIGSLAGTVTGVVQTRESKRPEAQDVVNIANMAFAQGVDAGQQMAQARGGFVDRIAAERASQTQKTR